MRAIIKDTLLSPELFCADLRLDCDPPLPGPSLRRFYNPRPHYIDTEYLVIDDILHALRVQSQPPLSTHFTPMSSLLLPPQLRPSAFLFDILDEPEVELTAVSKKTPPPFIDPLFNAARQRQAQDECDTHHVAVLPGQRHF
jgi:hypothetical protein